MEMLRFVQAPWIKNITVTAEIRTLFWWGLPGLRLMAKGFLALNMVPGSPLSGKADSNLISAQ